MRVRFDLLELKTAQGRPVPEVANAASGMTFLLYASSILQLFYYPLPKLVAVYSRDCAIQLLVLNFSLAISLFVSSIFN